MMGSCGEENVVWVEFSLEYGQESKNNKQKIPNSIMKSKQKMWQMLYQNYRQFIQFLNDLSFPPIVYLCIMYLPTFTIFGDLLTHIPDTHFLHNLSGISMASLLMRQIGEIGWVMDLVKIVLILVLVLPVGVVIFVAVFSLGKVGDEQVEIGYFYQVYSSSTICRIIRLHVNLFERVILPIIVSLSMKIILINTNIVGIAILILALINSFVFQYYSLQIPSGIGIQIQPKSTNFPNIIIETILITVSIVLVNMHEDLVAYIGCVCLFVVRVLTSHLFQFENTGFYEDYQFMLLCSNCFAGSLLIGKLSNQHSVMMVCACLAIFMLGKVRGGDNFGNNKYVEVKAKLDSEEVTLEDVKNDLKSEKIAKTFRQAVWISRRKHSHRDELTIDIIKSKCYRLQCESRGSTKMSNTLLLLQYQVRIVQIIKKTLVVQEKAVEALTIMKSKQPKQQMLVNTVVQLVNLINQNKRIFIECIKINALATQLTVLMHLFFKELYNDSLFLREVKSEYRDQIKQVQYKRISKQLFTKDAVLMVINIIDQVGKITKVSNNMANVLGYPAHTLIGLSINELLPLSIRQIHDNIIKNFVSSFTSDVMRQKPSVEFYGYDNMFHLQKVEVRYKFFLHNFENLELSSIVRKLKTEDHVILTDQYGNIEGWTDQVGEMFNFDELSGTDCSAYNLIPLIPAFAKYQNRADFSFKTLLFRLAKMKNPKLILFDFKKQKPQVDQIKRKQIQTFHAILEKSEAIQAYYVNVEVTAKVLERYNKAVKIIKLTQIKRLENFDKIQSLILQGSISNKQETQQQKYNFEIDALKSMTQEQEAQFSMMKTSQQQITNIDLNFTLDPKLQSLEYTDLKFAKQIERLQSILSTRSFAKLDKQQQNQDLTKINQNLNIQSNFNPKLERGNNMIWLVIIITMIVTSLIIEDEVSLQKIYTQLLSNKTQIAKTNRAEMIYCKSVFNANHTYIMQFDNGQLLMQSKWLLDNKGTYVSYNGDVLSQNQFYLLNVQIPSTLDRIIYEQGQTSSPHAKELTDNFYNMISLYEKTYQKYVQMWEVQVESAKKVCQYKMIVFAFGALVYLISLIFIQRSYKNQRKTVQAFFKFQRADLNQRIYSIRGITSVLQKRCTEWFIDQYLNQIKKGKQNPLNKKTTQVQTFNQVKKDPLQNSQYLKQKPQLALRKVAVEGSDQIQVQIQKKRFNTIMGLIAVVLCTQILFLILHGVLTSNMLNSYKDVINKFDQASKLTVYPNLKMASLFQTVPTQILNKYEQYVHQTLDQPIDFMPNLYNLLQQKPCSSCTFMLEILNTNFRSFYSYFDQTVSMNLTADSLQELYYAVDVVVEQITNSLQTSPVSSPRAVVVIYVFSVIVFFASVILILNQLESEYTKLETFLKFFDVEALLKNKHMSTVMSKNM